MAPNSESDAIKSIDGILSSIDDPATKIRILEWAWSKFGGAAVPTPTSKKKTHRGSPAKRGGAKKAKSGGKSKSKYSVVNDLKLNPSSTQTFRAFVKEKSPKSDQEKCIVAVYYLAKKLHVSSITPNHIYTCYKDISTWRVPNIRNVLAIAATRKGWVDTSDMNSIVLTTTGENMVEFDLPSKSEKTV